MDIAGSWTRNARTDRASSAPCEHTTAARLISRHNYPTFLAITAEMESTSSPPVGVTAPSPHRMRLLDPFGNDWAPIITCDGEETPVGAGNYIFNNAAAATHPFTVRQEFNDRVCRLPDVRDRFVLRNDTMFIGADAFMTGIGVVTAMNIGEARLTVEGLSWLGTTTRWRPYVQASWPDEESNHVVTFPAPKTMIWFEGVVRGMDLAFCPLIDLRRIIHLSIAPCATLRALAMH
ncbi:hypothetical protein V8E36_001108 [Tilletia maclaganii]